MPQASVAVQVMDFVRKQPIAIISDSAQVTVGVLHPSVAVGDGTLVQFGMVVGLQPRFTVAGGQPDNTGGAKSTVQV